MPEKKEVLKKNDAVYIKEWNAYGKVLMARAANIHEPEEDGYYQVQANPHYFRGSDLELDTSEADNEAREIRIAEKVARRDAARNRLQQAISAGSISAIQVGEYLAAEDEVWKEKGLPSLFRKKP
jgi:hypothetical protein